MLVFFFVVGEIRRPTDETQFGVDRLRSISWAGFAANVPMALCLVLAFQWGGNQYVWSNWRVILLLALAGVLLVSFLSIEHWAGDGGLVPLKMLRQRMIVCASLITFCNFAHLFLLAYYVSRRLICIHFGFARSNTSFLSISKLPAVPARSLLASCTSLRPFLLESPLWLAARSRKLWTTTT